MTASFVYHGVHRERGVVLFVALIMLIVLTLSALATANSAVMQQKMVAATRNRQLAQQSAESAISEARTQIAYISATSGSMQVCSHLKCFARPSDAPDNPAELMRTDYARAAMNSFYAELTTLSGEDRSARATEAPSFVVEDLGVSTVVDPFGGSGGGTPLRRFRVTGVGFGGAPGYSVTLEALYDLSP